MLPLIRSVVLTIPALLSCARSVECPPPTRPAPPPPEVIVQRPPCDLPPIPAPIVDAGSERELYAAIARYHALLLARLHAAERCLDSTEGAR